MPTMGLLPMSEASDRRDMINWQGKWRLTFPLPVSIPAVELKYGGPLTNSKHYALRRSLVHCVVHK